MISDALFRSIEDPAFTSSIGVVSTPRALDKAMLEQLPVRQLLACLSDPENRRELLARVTRLIAAAHDARYCHPYDLAIAIYLRTLDVCDPSLAIKAADDVLQHPNFWWARTFALPLMAEPNLRIPVQVTEYTPYRTPTMRRYDHATSTPLVAASEFAFAKPFALAQVGLLATPSKLEPPAELRAHPGIISIRTHTLAQ